MNVNRPFGFTWKQLIAGMIVSFIGLIVGSHIIIRVGGREFAR